MWNDKSNEEKDKILRESYKRMLVARVVNCLIAALIITFMFTVYEKQPAISNLAIYTITGLYLGAGIWFFYQIPSIIMLIVKCYVMSTEALFVFSKKNIKFDVYSVKGGSKDVHYLRGPNFKKYYLEEVPDV